MPKTGEVVGASGVSSRHLKFLKFAFEVFLVKDIKGLSLD